MTKSKKKKKKEKEKELEVSDKLLMPHAVWGQ
jgi:hypothetical protein